MSSVPLTSSTACTHDLGPGTHVCLRCRQEQRDASRARQRGMFALGGGAAMGLLGLYVMGASAANAWRASTKDTLQTPPRASVSASSVSVSNVSVSSVSGAGADEGEVQQQGGPSAAAVSASTPTPVTLAVAGPSTPAAAQPPFSLIVREGRSDLPDSLIVERGGDSVIVDFDTQTARTRRRDKFESVVRRTLPLVYGPRIDSVLRALPDGAIVGGADLLAELPKRGVHLKVAEGWTLDLWPETRSGQDGPLVVSYRARVTRDGALR